MIGVPRENTLNEVVFRALTPRADLMYAFCSRVACAVVDIGRVGMDFWKKTIYITLPTTESDKPGDTINKKLKRLQTRRGSGDPIGCLKPFVFQIFLVCRCVKFLSMTLTKTQLRCKLSPLG